MSNDDLTPSPLEGGSAAAAGKSREVGRSRPWQNPTDLHGFEPDWCGQFDDFSSWVNHATRALTDERDDDGIELTALCIDTKGRLCTIGKHFMRAHDEGTFPIRYFFKLRPLNPPVGVSAALRAGEDFEVIYAPPPPEIWMPHDENGCIGGAWCVNDVYSPDVPSTHYVRADARQSIRAEVIEECAKIAKTYATKAGMRAELHTDPMAKEAALSKVEAATDIEIDIRSRLHTASGEE